MKTRADTRALRVSDLRRGALAILASALAWGPSCAPPAVTFDLTVPSSVVKSVAWFEVGVFPTEACPPADELAGGIPPEGTLAHVAFPASDTSPPPVGTLAKGTYGFAAVARGSDCSVLAAGCQTIDVHNDHAVSVLLDATNPPAGACENGTVCEAARCVPGNDNSSPSVGSGCSLDLIGTGPLGDPLGYASTLLTAPVVVTTSAGFLIAYRELDPTAVVGRLSLIPVDSGGGTTGVQSVTLPGVCPVTNSYARGEDATALAFEGDNGLVALARAPCNGGASGATIGIDFFAVDPLGNVPATNGSGFKSLPGSKVTLATSHALAATPNGLFLAMTVDGQTYEAPVSGLDLTQPPVTFGAAPPETAAWVAGSNQATALLALGTGIASAPVDAGPDGSVPSTDASAVGAPTLRLYTASPTEAVGTLQPTDIPATWGSVSMAGTRALIASSGFTQGEPVVWSTFDVDNPTPVATGGFSTTSLGKIVYSDVTLQQDHAFFAVEVAGLVGTISLVALDHVSTTPVFLREVPFAGEPRISIGDLRDGFVSVAASDTRVAVVWGTARTLGPNDTVGGYAVFACTP